jgi:aminopeptidase N
MLLKIVFCLLFVTIFINQSFAQQTPPIEPGVSRELARWRATNYSDVRYKLNLTLEKQSPTLKGSIEISLQNKAAQIILDWRKIKGKEQFAGISNIKINGSPAKFEEVNEHLVFREGVKAGENVISLDFTSPIATSGAAVTRYVDKEDGAEYIYSLFVPSDASTAFPCFDQPDLKAKFRLQIKSNSFAKAISNMTSHRLIINGKYGLFNFRETLPISTYVFAFAVGDFIPFSEADYSKELTLPSSTNGKFVPCPMEALEKGDDCINFIDTGSNIYIRKSQAEKFKQHAAEVFRLNRESVKYLETYFDYKFPFPKYDLVLIPEFPFGGMEHAGATFLREDRVIFPSEPTANDYITRGNLIFHEAAHQWFGDTVTMRWFDDLWLKEGFAEFMAYKTMEKVLPQYNAWKAFYERNKPLAYLTDSTKGTTPIYQEISNLSAAKSAYGNIVYRKAPSFLRQAEFYLGEKQFQAAVRAFLKQNAFKNAEWQDLVKSVETASGQNLRDWANVWVKKRGIPTIRVTKEFDPNATSTYLIQENVSNNYEIREGSFSKDNRTWTVGFNILKIIQDRDTKKEKREISKIELSNEKIFVYTNSGLPPSKLRLVATIPNYQDYGYGIFLLDKQSRDYVLANIQNEKDDFLRAMMWGALWDSMREAELDPKDYIELAIKNIGTEKDELTIQTILGRVGTAMNYYLSEPPAVAGGTRTSDPPATAGGSDISARLEKVLINRMTNAETLGQRIVFYRAFVNLASTENGRQTLKDILNSKFQISNLKLKTKDKFDIVTRLLILNDADAPKLLENLAKTETSDEAKRYAYAARAGVATAENKRKFFDDFTGNKEISESWIESAFVPFNSTRHKDLTLPYLEKALAELPSLKRNRKIFFVNGWLAAFIGGQRDEKALETVNKFLADNPNLDKDLRLKILEVSDGLERSIKIRKQFASK